MMAEVFEVRRSQIVVWIATIASFVVCAGAVYAVAPLITGLPLDEAWTKLGSGTVLLSSPVVIVWIGWTVGSGALVSLYTAYRPATRVWRRWRRAVQVLAPAGLVSLVVPLAFIPVSIGVSAETEEEIYAANLDAAAPVLIVTVVGFVFCIVAAVIWPLAARRHAPLPSPSTR